MGSASLQRRRVGRLAVTRRAPGTSARRSDQYPCDPDDRGHSSRYPSQGCSRPSSELDQPRVRGVSEAATLASIHERQAGRGRLIAKLPMCSPLPSPVRHQMAPRLPTMRNLGGLSKARPSLWLYVTPRCAGTDSPSERSRLPGARVATTSAGSVASPERTAFGLLSAPQADSVLFASQIVQGGPQCVMDYQPG